MSPELDAKLCSKYPKIFANRYGDMKTTAMCWGFECGDGWYQILNSLCSQIQHHIDWKEKQRRNALEYNQALESSSKNNLEPLILYFQGTKDSPTIWDIQRAEEIFEDPEPQCREVPEECPQVVASQVKEKFGGLRFYYDGGDDAIDGMVRMAESWAANTCETCGKPGSVRGGGWIVTLCDEHAEARGIYTDEKF